MFAIGPPASIITPYSWHGNVSRKKNFKNLSIACMGDGLQNAKCIGGELSKREGVLFHSVDSEGRNFSSFFHRFTPNKT